MTAKRFTSEYNNQSDMIQYIDTQKEEPNRWSICNVSETLKKLNNLHEENSLLKDIIKDIVIKLEANYTSNTYEMTIPINRVIYNELRRRLKETSFNEELRRFLDD